MIPLIGVVFAVGAGALLLASSNSKQSQSAGGGSGGNGLPNYQYPPLPQVPPQIDPTKLTCDQLFAQLPPALQATIATTIQAGAGTAIALGIAADALDAAHFPLQAQCLRDKMKAAVGPPSSDPKTCDAYFAEIPDDPPGFGWRTIAKQATQTANPDQLDQLAVTFDNAGWHEQAACLHHQAADIRAHAQGQIPGVPPIPGMPPIPGTLPIPGGYTLPPGVPGTIGGYPVPGGVPGTFGGYPIPAIPPGYVPPQFYGDAGPNNAIFPADTNDDPSTLQHSGLPPGYLPRSDL